MKIKFSGKNKIIALENNKQIGYLDSKYPNDISKKRNLEISYIYVIPKFRRRGIATNMLKFLVQKFKQRVLWINLWTGKQMETNQAQGLYKKLGFKKLAYQADYYDNNVGSTLFAIRTRN